MGSYDGTAGTNDAASYYGCYDMSGNAWEWCYDWYAADYYSNSPEIDPIGPATGTFRLIRGGSWGNPIGTVRTSKRADQALPTARGSHTGFRTAAGIQ